jgi:large subunit ribosomal protein L25
MQTTLAAIARPHKLGKSDARKVRLAGSLPAVVYGPHEEATPIEINPKQLVEIFRKSGNRNTVVELELGGQTVPCLVREVQRHPLSREILHVDFFKVAAGREVEVQVPVKPVGKAKGLSLGGRVLVVRRKLTIRCAYDKIPESITFDVGPLEIGDKVMVSQMTAPEGATIVFDQDFQVILLAGKVRERAEVAAEGTPEAAKPA